MLYTKYYVLLFCIKYCHYIQYYFGIQEIILGIKKIKFKTFLLKYHTISCTEFIHF